MLHPARLMHPLALVSLILASIALQACSSVPEKTVRETATVTPPAIPISCQEEGGIQLGCPAFPDTTPQQQPDWDYFAWNSFFAANWPALIPANNNRQRGFPDLTQSFPTASPNALLVWETFKEKREIFLDGPGSTTVTAPGPWNQAPVYGPIDQSIPLCADSLSHPQGRTPLRFFGQGGKVVFDSLDETAEVLSEALESTQELCAGHSANPMCGTPEQAPCCLVAQQPVGPRVWKGSPTKQNPQPVVYEVKLNYDYYDYVTSNQLYNDATAATQAGATKILLPYRTSAQSGPKGNPAGSGITGYSSQECLALDQTVTPTSNVTPCAVGSMQIKAAWIPLQDEDPSQYHTAEAAYFKTENGSTCMSYATFGLVGLHIIQRIHQGSGPGNAAAAGGTYVFATWEHVDNDTAGFTYANCFPGQASGSPPSGFYPTASSALAVQRMFPILANTQQVNNDVHAAIQKIDPGSVWLNYQLTGTQFQAIDSTSPAQARPAQAAFPVSPNDPTGIGQPLFLSNLVIETNHGLQNFQGLPPNIAPIAQFAKYTAGTAGSSAYDRGANNLPFAGTGYNMGGCMGCHGVAALKGYSFSFVLLDGQAGAGVDTQQNFSIPPGPVACNPM